MAIELSNRRIASRKDILKHAKDVLMPGPTGTVAAYPTDIWIDPWVSFGKQTWIWRALKLQGGPLTFRHCGGMTEGRS